MSNIAFPAVVCRLTLLVYILIFDLVLVLFVVLVFGRLGLCFRIAPILHSLPLVARLRRLTLMLSRSRSHLHSVTTF
jgi:hypothetical protein